MEEQIIDLLSELGPFGIVAVALLYVVRMAREMAPSESTQTQMFGFMERQLKVIERLEIKIEEGDNKIAEAVATFSKFVEVFTQRAGIEQERDTQKIDVIQKTVNLAATQLQTITGAIDTMSKSTELDEISEKLNQLIKEVRVLAEIRPLIERFGERLDSVEQSVPPLKSQIEALTTHKSSKDTANALPQPTDTSPTESPVPISKTNAKRKSDEIPKVKPNDNLHDPAPTGG